MSDVVVLSSITAGSALVTVALNLGYNLWSETRKGSREEIAKANEHTRTVGDKRTTELREATADYFAFLVRFEIGMQVFEEPTDQNRNTRDELLVWSLDHMEKAAKTAGRLRVLAPDSDLADSAEQSVRDASSIIAEWHSTYAVHTPGGTPYEANSSLPASVSFRAVKHAFHNQAVSALSA